MRVSDKSAFEKNVSKTGDGKPKTDEQQGSADPGHEGPIRHLSVAFFGKFIGKVLFLGGWLFLQKSFS